MKVQKRIEILKMINCQGYHLECTLPENGLCQGVRNTFPLLPLFPSLVPQLKNTQIHLFLFLFFLVVFFLRLFVDRSSCWLAWLYLANKCVRLSSLSAFCTWLWIRPLGLLLVACFFLFIPGIGEQPTSLCDQCDICSHRSCEPVWSIIDDNWFLYW